MPLQPNSEPVGQPSGENRSFGVATPSTSASVRVKPAAKEGLGFRRKLAFSSGVFLDGPGLHAVNFLAYPVYNVILGVNPALIGYALASFRLFDAFTDPLVGYFTDRTRSRWGRRKPFMLVGAFFCAVLFPLAWFASPNWTSNQMLAFFIGINLLYFTAHSFYSIPFKALGMELTPDYDERTSVFTYLSWFMNVGFMAIFWVYPLAQNAFFATPLEGVRWLTVLLGVVFFGTALIPILFLQERFGQPGPAPQSTARSAGMIANMAAAFRNPTFARIATIQVVLVFGSNAVGSLAFYVNTYYLYGGDMKAAAPLLGIGGTVSGVLTLLAMPLIPLLSGRFGKGGAVAFCLGLQLLASALKWLLFIPSLPWLSLIPMALINIGNIGFWTLGPAMVSDVCDLDELESGQRREGLFASVTQWLNKLGYTAATALSGVILVWIGFDAAKGGGQSEASLLWMRLLFILVPAAAFIVGLLLLRGLNLTRERMHAVRGELELRRGAR